MSLLIAEDVLEPGEPVTSRVVWKDAEDGMVFETDRHKLYATDAKVRKFVDLLVDLTIGPEDKPDFEEPLSS